MEAQAGFALIEVLISAVILALIVIGMFTGFDVANRASAGERARAQADVLAQQDEDHLRSLQIGQLSSLNETHNVTYNGTVYTVESTGEFIADSTGATSCSEQAQEASYVRTTSKVTWYGSGTRHPVVETGLITPPPGGALLVQVFNARGAPLSGMTVKATGPSPAASSVSAITGVKGCVIFAGLPEGEYQATAFQAGYVDKNGNSEPLPAEQSVTIVPGTTDKRSFEFDRPGALSVTFETTNGAEATGDTFVAQNSSIPTPGFRTFGTAGTYAATVTSPKTLLPYGSPGPPVESPYAVYGGTCEADEPSNNGQPVSSDRSINVLPNETSSIKVLLPAVNMQVFAGTTSASEKVTSFSGTLTDEGNECAHAVHPFSTTTAVNGELHKAMPFGKFTLCVASNGKVGAPAEYRKLKSTLVENKTATGSSLYTIYLGSGEHKGSAYTCP
jgi:Tfp pilus assembly protein PilV